MTEPLNESTRTKARELAQRITVAHNLDPEIQEELYGHIEDKMRAYCSGEEPVSPEDAFILAREHFGDAKALRGLLQEVHVEAVEVSLLRRMLALLITMKGVGLAGGVVAALLQIMLSPILAAGSFLQPILYHVIVLYGTTLVGLVAVVWLLRRWNHVMRAGATPWYCRQSIGRMATWLGLLFVAGLLFPAVGYYPETSADPAMSGGWLQLQLWFGVVQWISYFALWLWWTGTFSRSMLHKILVGTLYVAYSLLYLVSPGRLIISLLPDTVTLDGGTYFFATQVLNVKVVFSLYQQWAMLESWRFLYLPAMQLTVVVAFALLLHLASCLRARRWGGGTIGQG